MVASQALVLERPESPETVVREMTDHMETLAASGDWAEVENMVVRLRRALLNVPEAERHELLLFVRRSTERIAAAATEARKDVTGQITAIRRGRKATEAYELR